MSRVRILAIGVDKVTMGEAVARCLDFVRSGRPHLVVTPNAEITYAATRDPELAGIINGADLVVPDGAGVVLASRILGDPVPEKVAGVELSTNLVAELSRMNGSVYLLGTRPEVVQVAAHRLKERFPGLAEVYFHHGFFKPEETEAVVAGIRAKRPQALFVGMGAPRQERWLARHLQALGVPVCIGVGGTLDVWAGVASRGPEWMVRANLEWLYRVVKMGRYGRSLPPLVKFMLKVMAQRVWGR